MVLGQWLHATPAERKVLLAIELLVFEFTTRAFVPIAMAAAVGLIGVLFPRSLAVGYDNIAGLLAGRFGPGLVAGILLAKAAAWSLSPSSGTSGGVLAPLLTIGGAAGALVGYATQRLSGIPVGLVALVCMAAVFGASARATLTAILFAAEVTGHYETLLPLLITCTVADYLAVHLLPYTVMTGKLRGCGVTVVQDYHAPWPGLPGATGAAEAAATREE